jgi:hypothetical protein
VDAAFGGFVLFEQVESNAVEHGEVLCGIARAFVVEVFAEADIEHPVQLTFDAQCWRMAPFSCAASGLILPSTMTGIPALRVAANFANGPQT